MQDVSSKQYRRPVHHPVPGARASHASMPLTLQARLYVLQGSPSRTACADRWSLMIRPACSHACVSYKLTWRARSPHSPQRSRPSPAARVYICWCAACEYASGLGPPHDGRRMSWAHAAQWYEQMVPHCNIRGLRVNVNVNVNNFLAMCI